MGEIAASRGVEARMDPWPQRVAVRRGNARRRIRSDVRRERQGNALFAGGDAGALMRRFALAVALSLPFVGVGVALTDDAEMAKKRASEVGLQPGMVLDSSNAGLAKGLLPPEILKHYEKGEYKNTIVDWPPGMGTLGPEFDAQTKRNAESQSRRNCFDRRSLSRKSTD